MLKKILPLLFCFLVTICSLKAQVINQYPLSQFGGSISSVVGAVNSYNDYITSGGSITAPLDGSVNALSSALTQNQKNVDAALARVINAQFNTVAYNSLTGTPLYVGNQQAINQLIRAF